MDLNAYKMKRESPFLGDFREVQRVRTMDGDFNTVVVYDNVAFQEEQKKFREEERRLFGKFLMDLKAYLGIENNPKADIFLARAIARANEGGLQGIYNWARDMVDLIL